MNRRTEKRLYERGVASGKVTPFYKPSPKPPAPPVAEEPEPDRMAARDVLSQLLEGSKAITDVLVLMRDDDGQLGFVTNLDGIGESCLFIDRVKHRILEQDRAAQTTPPAPRGA